MGKKKQKYYVVWQGHNPGIYNTWDKARKEVEGYPDADYKSYKTKQEAQFAWKNYKLAKQQIKANKKKMYYVIWEGLEPGIYDDWEEAKAQIEGFTSPKYKSFGSRQMAEKAFSEDYEKYRGRFFKKIRDMSPEEMEMYGEPNELSISVDAACNKEGDMEYRGVYTYSTDEIFKVGPYKNGSNNVGEFLAIVHALAWAKNENTNLPIYSDSKHAMKWVTQKKANSKVTDPKLLNLIQRAEYWLKNNTYNNEIIKWQTKFWGEIPADFGRK